MTNKNYYYFDTCVLFTAIHDSFKKNIAVKGEDGMPQHFGLTLRSGQTMNLLRGKDGDVFVTSQLSLAELLCKIKRENYSLLSNPKIPLQKLIEIIKDYLNMLQVKLIYPDSDITWDDFLNFCALSPEIEDKKGKKTGKRNSVQDYIHLHNAYLLYKKNQKAYFVTSDQGILDVKDAYSQGTLRFPNIISLDEYVKKMKKSYDISEKKGECSSKLGVITFRNIKNYNSTALTQDEMLSYMSEMKE
jgi:hypothetical protein